MRFTHALPPFTYPYLMMRLVNLCSSWPTYAYRGLGLMGKGVCCSPPRPSQTIVALSSFNRPRKKMCSSQFASPSSSPTPMTRAGRAAAFQRKLTQSYISSCSPLKGSNTPDLSGSIRGRASPAAMPNTVYPFFRKWPPRLPPLSTLNRDPLTDITL
jgi:hypothetical protein